MSYGRKDYFWGVAPEKSVFGELQASKTITSANTIASGATVGLVQQFAPAGYIWHVTSVMVTSPLPGINGGSIYVDAALKCFFNWDSVINISLGEGGVITVNPGEKLWVYVTNNDSISIYFTAFTCGFMQQVVR